MLLSPRHARLRAEAGATFALALPLVAGQVLTILMNVVDTMLEENVHDILCSALVDDCIERAKSIKQGGAKYDWVSGLQVGIANLGNSLAAVKKLVFDQGLIGQQELAGTQLRDQFGQSCLAHEVFMRCL